MQWAFAKIKESWHDAVIVSSHGREDIGKIIKTATYSNKIGIFTSNGDEPKKIAEALLKNELKGFTAYICEDLGSSTEKITTCSLNEVRLKTFSPLNVMILIRNSITKFTPPLSPLPQGEGKDKQQYPPPLMGGGKGEGGKKGFQINAIFGFPDCVFSHSAGLITKEEIRAISLSKMRIRENSVIWDIGAGSGSIAIEAGRVAKMGKVYAIEKKHERIEQIKKNIKNFSM
ncbi:MAG: precorrin-6Y C5,15-methyltransferase (decarboxylating) subunit CbiT, partial [Nitrospirae bacterium]|nr:precorrin-6Y C5,15-methyltransferase (decarboxylating) subunit CbiT [Nitrospirota bacterium]